MITKENYSEEHIRQIQNDSHRDPLLIERTLFAFGLLGLYHSTNSSISRKLKLKNKDVFYMLALHMTRFVL